METCAVCGEPIQYDEGKLTQTGLNPDGISQDYRCGRCGGPVLAEAILRADSAAGNFVYGPVELRWEVGRHPDAPAGMVGRCLRTFLVLLHRAMEKIPVGRRARAERALRDLVGPGGPHAQTCACPPREANPGLCPYCRARAVARAIQPRGGA